MRIQYFNGGLANQVFQYIFYRYGQLTTGHPEEWFLDDSFFFFKHQHNGYELEKVFGLKPNLLSEQLGADAWNALVENRKNGIGMADNLANLGFHVSMIAEAQNYKTDNPFSGKVWSIPCNEYHPDILKWNDEIVYYFGYWINKNWINAYRDLFLEELAFPPILDDKNLKYASRIKSTLSVGVHIRRGDYLNLGIGIDPVFIIPPFQKYLHPIRNLLYLFFQMILNGVKITLMYWGYLWQKRSYQSVEIQMVQITSTCSFSVCVKGCSFPTVLSVIWLLC